jgi:hypothetical protein
VTPQAICDVLKNSRATDIISAEKHLIDVLNDFQLEPHFQI